jgi:hypothetical protein
VHAPQPRPLARLLAVLALAVGLSLGLAGCSGGGSADTADGAKLPDGFTALAKTDFYREVLAAQRRSGSVHVDSQSVGEGGHAIPASADLSFHDDQVDVHSTVTGATGVLETVLVGKQFYAKGLSHSGPPWWHVNLRAQDAGAQVLRGMLAQADPGRQLAALSEPASFELLGAAEIDGQETAHYELTVDAADYYRKLGAKAPDQPGTINLDLWLDKDNRPVRTVTTSGQGALRTTTTATYSGYGEGAPITAPPAGEVTDESPFAK